MFILQWLQSSQISSTVLKMHTKDLAYTQCLNQNTINVHSVVKNMIRKCMLISRGNISYLELIFDGTRDICL